MPEDLDQLERHVRHLEMEREAVKRDGDKGSLGQHQEQLANLEEERTEWGNLPERVRDMLLQGSKEKFSSLYKQLTREYYRRLAEEGSP